MISRWQREFSARSGNFSKRKVLSVETQKLKAFKKELTDVMMNRNSLKKAVSIFSKSDL